MRVVIAVTGWPGRPSRDAANAASIVSGAWLEARPHDVVTALPMADGGPRSADALAGQASLVGGAQLVRHGGALWLSPAGGATRWSPIDLSVALLGIAAAAEDRPTVVVPLGDSDCAGDAATLWGTSLVATRKALEAVNLVALVASRRPLLGFQGMSAALLDRAGADASLLAAAADQESRWRALAATGDAVAARGALIGPSRLSDEPGTGAAGGLAYALAALGARLTPAMPFVADAAGLPSAVAAGADLVVAVCGELDPRSLDHGVALPVSQAAAAAGVPAVALASAVGVGRRDLMAAGLAAAHEAGEGADALAAGVTRLAHTWSRD